jgi:ribose transport system ATP-binding protein
MNQADTLPLLLEAKQVTKRFPGVMALKGVCLELHPGEVLSLIGENGAGKSTLMKILAGVQPPDEGQILLDGQPVQIDSCRAALDMGICLIHQELNLADNLTVAANIYLGREPRRRGLIDDKKMAEDAQVHLKAIGLDVSPTTVVSQLPIGQQQMVEIAKALSVNARILIMDEPTSSLSTKESVALFKVIKDLRNQGVSIIYISHRLGEVAELSDRVTVFRDGENAGNLNRDKINHDSMVRLMVGRDISQFYAHKPHTPGAVSLEARDLVCPEWPAHALNFKVHSGEIVGMAGLVGAGRTEMLRVLFGLDAAVSGQLLIQDEPVALRSPMDAIRLGLALLPEDRKQHGLILEMAVKHNVGLPGLRRFQKKMGFLNAQREQDDALKMIGALRIKTPGPDQPVQYLSGGNQQKVVLAKWLSLEPKVLLLDEPTRGVDIGAKQEIYGLMEDLAAKGVAILFVSSEMEEILGMSDRALVMHEGHITGQLKRDELSEERIMQLATGQVHAA